MSDGPLHTLTARGLAARVAAGAVSAVEVARHFIERVERLNPGLNAIVQFDPALVLEEAASVDHRLAGSVPCGFDSVGMPIGLQVAGRPFDEVTVLRCAAAVEEIVGITRRPC